MSRHLMRSRLCEVYRFEELHQQRGFGGISVAGIRTWTEQLAELKPDLIRVSGLGNEAFPAMAAAKRAGVRYERGRLHFSPEVSRAHIELIRERAARNIDPVREQG